MSYFILNLLTPTTAQEGWGSIHNFLCKSGYFMQFLATIVLAFDHYSHIIPHGSSSWKLKIFVHIWTLHLIPSKIFLDFIDRGV